jgi:hypothetical protein
MRVEADSGIKAGDRVILNPPVTLVDGSKVQPRGAADEAGLHRSGASTVDAAVVADGRKVALHRSP